MTKKYDPNALLYLWTLKEEDGIMRLIGTDPALADRSTFFRWKNVPGGWDHREPWPHGPLNADPCANAKGEHSGWPGASPLPARPVGRPRKEVSADERPTNLSTSVRRSELFVIQKLASEDRKSVSEWVASVIRDRLQKEGVAVDDDKA